MRRFRKAQSRRRVQWLGGAQWSEGYTGTVPTVAGSSEVAALWVGGPAGTFDTLSDREVEVDWTVIREINQGFFSVKQGATGNLGYMAGMGVIAWDGISDDFPASTDVPFPVQTPGFDWLWWWAFSDLDVIAAGVTKQVASGNGPEGMVFQKSQRKLSAGTGLLLVVEVFATIDGNNATWGFGHNSRYAYKLP